MEILEQWLLLPQGMFDFIAQLAFVTRFVCSIRELATQIFDVMTTFTNVHTQFHLQLLVGGSDIHATVRSFEQTHEHTHKRKQINIIVGTPGRILDVRNRLTNSQSHLATGEKNIVLSLTDLSDLACIV